MIPNTFDYHAPKTLKKAISLLNEHEDAKILAGGHSLIPLMKLRFASPAVVIDIGRVSGISRIKIADGQIHIGALTTHHAIASNARLRRVCAALPETALEIGDAQVRNRGTLGGSVVHADPAADWPATMLALRAEFEVGGPSGTRTISAGDFFVDMMTTSIQDGEILSQIRIPVPSANTGSAYAKIHQSASGFAIAGVAAQLTLDGSGNISAAGVAVTGVAPIAYVASAVESALIGNSPDEATLTSAAALAANDASDANEDLHASGEYRKHLATVLAGRALTSAAERATS